jgi:hypothetical protein
VPDTNLSEDEVAIAKLKTYKQPGSDQIPAELIQARGKILWSEIHKLFKFISKKEERSDQLKESIILPIYMKSDEIDCSNYRGTSLLSTSKFYSISFSQG